MHVMAKRTTIELDEKLVARAKRALGCRTTRDTVHEALRLASEQAEEEFERRRQGQMRVLRNLGKHLDLEVLASEEMWR
jgi:Arc/MetJ family transcription regulator